MARNLGNAETVRLAEELERLRPERSGLSRHDRLRALARLCARLPERDPHLADEIVGYDENGLP